MIGVMSAGPSLVLLSILCAILVFYLAKVIMKTPNQQPEQEEEDEDKKKLLYMSVKEICFEMLWLPCKLYQKPSGKGMKKLWKFLILNFADFHTILAFLSPFLYHMHSKLLGLYGSWVHLYIYYFWYMYNSLCAFSLL